MHIIPAIDVLDGSVVRLLRGDYDAVTVYSDDPVASARTWSIPGVQLVHVVDLDAARGLPRDEAVLRRLGADGISFQVGGGIRTPDDARAAIDAGAERVVVGSAFTSPDARPDRIVAAVGADRVVAALDVREGRAFGSGWLDAGATLDAALRRVVDTGVHRALVTGIERDGTLAGPDVALLDAVHRLASDVELIASGGVGSIGDLEALAGLPNVEAAIVGRALYEGRFTIAQAVDAASKVAT